MNYLEGEPLKVGMTTFSLMAQIARGGGELVKGKICYVVKYPDSFYMVSFRHSENLQNISLLLSECVFTVHFNHFI